MAERIPFQQISLGSQLSDHFLIFMVVCVTQESGLNIRARSTGQRIGVEIPPGYDLLVQAGKQLEHITGGLLVFKAGCCQ